MQRRGYGGATGDPRPGEGSQRRRAQGRRVPPPSAGPAIPPRPARRPTVDPSPTADAEVGRRRASGFPMPAIPYFPPAPQSSPSPQAGLDPRNRPAPPRAARGREAQPTGIQGIPPQAGPPQIAGQGPTPSYAAQAPIGSAMPSFGQNWVARSQNPYAYGLAQSGILNQTQTQWPQRFPGNVT